MANKQLVTVAVPDGSVTILLSNITSIQRNGDRVRVYDLKNQTTWGAKLRDLDDADRVETELVTAWKAYWGII